MRVTIHFFSVFFPFTTREQRDNFRYYIEIGDEVSKLMKPG